MHAVLGIQYRSVFSYFSTASSVGTRGVWKTWCEGPLGRQWRLPVHRELPLGLHLPPSAHVTPKEA